MIRCGASGGANGAGEAGQRGRGAARHRGGQPQALRHLRAHAVLGRAQEDAALQQARLGECKPKMS